MATHSSILAWKSPWTEESGGLKSMELHDWACVHEGGGRWVGSNKVLELRKKISKEWTRQQYYLKQKYWNWLRIKHRMINIVIEVLEGISHIKE